MTSLEIAEYLSKRCNNDSKTVIKFLENMLEIEIKVRYIDNEYGLGNTAYYIYNENIIVPIRENISLIIMTLWKYLDAAQQQKLIDTIKSMQGNKENSTSSSKTKKTFQQIIDCIHEKYSRLDTLIRQGILGTVNQEVNQIIDLLNEIELNNGIKYGEKLKEKLIIIQSKNVFAMRRGPLIESIEFYLQYLSEIKTILEICVSDSSSQKISNENITNNIFIVYGHDLEFREAIKDKINAFNIEHEDKNYQKVKPVLFDDEFTTGKTIIETLEKQTKKCNYAIILLTADDDGKNKKDVILKNRARQNVILEWGWFVGTVGRENVLVLVDEDDKLELPSDVLCLKWASKKTWRVELEKFLKHISNN